MSVTLLDEKELQWVNRLDSQVLKELETLSGGSAPVVSATLKAAHKMLFDDGHNVRDHNTFVLDLYLHGRIEPIAHSKRSVAPSVGMLKLPPEVLVMIILWSPPPYRHRLRATPSEVNETGEDARIVVRDRLRRANGWGMPLSQAHSRMSWWSPWVGQRVIFDSAPEDSGDNAARVKWTFELLWRNSHQRVDFGKRFLSVGGSWCEKELDCEKVFVYDHFRKESRKTFQARCAIWSSGVES